MTVTKRKPKPITAHPMFPAVTALWFAAFLSLGSFAVAPALLEGPVVALGIPEILPAAQPPLGFTVRALVAIVMMGVGGLAGFMIGRRLARGNEVAPVRARSFGRSEEKAAAPARSPLHRRPLNPSEDLGDPFAGAAFTPPSAFAEASAVPAAGADAPFAEPAEVSRLPWEDDQLVQTQPSMPVHAVLADDPLALDLLFEDAEVVAEEAATGERQEFMGSNEVLAAASFDANEPAEEPVEAKAFAPVEDVAAPAPDRPAVPLIKTPLLQAPAAAHVPIARTPLDELGLVQLTERLALAIGRRHARSEAAPQSVAPAAPYAVPTVEAFAAEPAPANVPDIEPESVPTSAAGDLGGFSVVAPEQAPALARFPSANADAVAEEPTPSLETERVVQLRPAALQPFVPEFDAEEHDDIPGLARFLGGAAPQHQAEPLGAWDDEDEFDDEEQDDTAPDFVQSADVGPEPDVAEERYPSLLDLGSGSNRNQALKFSHEQDDEDGLDESVADDAEPVVTFPGQSSPIHASPRPFERPSAIADAANSLASIIPVPGSPLASPGRAAPSSPIDALAEPETPVASTIVEAEEADRALRAALATLQRMTAQG